MKLRYFLIAIVLIVVSAAAGYYLGLQQTSNPLLPAPSFIRPRTLDKYTIENLSNRDFDSNQIIVEEELSDQNLFSSHLFSFSLDPDFDGRIFKKVTGLLNLPKGEGPFPAVVMFRGFVDQEIYETGMGTKRAGEYFAQRGFITLAPDFLGYASSDKEAEDIFETRFQTYVTAISLIERVPSISGWDGKNIFIWGHSNGGQIAIATLEITGEAYPTTLWAPVSKPFPYSVLYYTDESQDRGKLIRGELSKFEELYDPDLYSIDLYLERIKAPIQLHQGTADEAVPLSWSQKFTNKLEDLEIELEYFVYPGADHNLNPSWQSVVDRDLVFFNKNLK